MHSVSVKGHFYSAHLLNGYKGKCKNLHGHNYLVEVILQGNELNDIGILFDFSKLEHELNKILNTLDHTTILKECEENKSLIEVLKSMKSQVILFHDNPTAENLARYIYKKLKKNFFGNKKIKSMLRSVKVWETNDCLAEFKEEVQ